MVSGKRHNTAILSKQSRIKELKPLSHDLLEETIDNDDFSNSNSNKNNIKQSTQKNFGSISISGENIIDCRSFSIDSPKTFKFEGSYDNSVIAPIFGIPEIAFIGRSNVGKSSLLNMLSGLNKDIAVVSKTPGRTKLINMFKCADKDGDICVFVDLPGYGFAKMSKEEQSKISGFLTGYLRDRGSLRLVIILIDIRREPQDSDREIIEYLGEEGIEFVVVATKCDKLSNSQLLDALHKLNEEYNLPPGYPIPASSISGLGKKEIWKVIRSSIVGELFVDESDNKNDNSNGRKGADEVIPIIDDRDDPLVDIMS